MASVIRLRFELHSIQSQVAQLRLPTGFSEGLQGLIYQLLCCTLQNYLLSQLTSSMFAGWYSISSEVIHLRPLGSSVHAALRLLQRTLKRSLFLKLHATSYVQSYDWSNRMRLKFHCWFSQSLAFLHQFQKLYQEGCFLNGECAIRCRFIPTHSLRMPHYFMEMFTYLFSVVELSLQLSLLFRNLLLSHFPSLATP